MPCGRRDRQGHIDALHNSMWGHGLPGDPGVACAGHVHSCVPGAGWGVTAVHHDPELDALIKELKTIMDLGKRDAMITKVARITHERVAGGLPTPRPIATLAWREVKVTFNPWPPPGFWRSL